MTDKNENIQADRQLVEMVLAGDNVAFRMIINNTEALVAQIIFKLITNNEDRKDIAQDVYLKVFNRLGSFKFESRLSTWIARIAYNTCLTNLAKKKLFFPGDFEKEVEEEDPAERQAKDGTAEVFIFNKQQSEILKREIEQLPPLYKMLITLFHQEELSYQEIMDITGLPDGTLKNYLFRARKKLKNNLLLKYKKEDL